MAQPVRESGAACQSLRCRQEVYAGALSSCFAKANAHSGLWACSRAYHSLLRVPVRLGPEPHPHHAQAGRVAKTLGWPGLSINRQATMYNWEKQFELIRQGVAFLHATVSSNGAEPFDVVVRMRMVRDHKQFAPRA